MFRTAYGAGLTAGAAAMAIGLAADAAAHGFAGARFFPATIATDDPFAADELALPTFSTFKEGDATRTTRYSADFAKRITPDFAIEFGGSHVRAAPPGGPASEGFDNLALGAKYRLGVDAAHEAVFALGIDADLGGTGARRIAEDFTTITPSFLFGKGFGDLPDAVGLLRPFAVTGAIGVALPSRARSDDGLGEIEEHPDTLEVGLALEYSLPYLQSQVRNVGLGAPFDRMIPVIELSLETPLDRGGKTTGTVNPGLFWSGQYMQLGAEAVIPWNRDSGKSVGFLAQIHFYLDDIAPMSLGRPLFGE